MFRMFGTTGKPTMNNCIINVIKPEGITSQGVVTAVKRALGVKTAGHCGTLDPLATGVLPVMVGTAVKASEYLTDHDKLYVAKMRLGVTTNTGDVTGEIISKYDGKLPDIEDVISVLPKFVGKIVQVPPMYSALKVGGRKLVDLARQGIEVERKGREITIYRLCAEKVGEEIQLSVLCSRGTYIRTLVEDIGNALGCGATMSALCRSAVGTVTVDENSPKTDKEMLVNTEKICENCEFKSYTCEIPFCYSFKPMFSLENGVELEMLKGGNVSSNGVVQTEDVFYMYPKLSFPEFYERLFFNGCEIYLSKLDKNSPARGASVGDVFRVYSKDGFSALGEVREYEDGLAVKQKKRF